METFKLTAECKVDVVADYDVLQKHCEGVQTMFHDEEFKNEYLAANDNSCSEPREYNLENVGSPHIASVPLAVDGVTITKEVADH